MSSRIKQDDLEQEVGDFIIRRSDGLVAYQLATAIDDALQGITEVVRGTDLIDSTPRQVYLQNLLKLPSPTYAHLPVVYSADGKKLSKRHGALGAQEYQAMGYPASGMRNFLGHPPPQSICDTERLWQWAKQHWNLNRVPAQSRAAFPGADC